jgi:hypothetical protein
LPAIQSGTVALISTGLFMAGWSPVRGACSSGGAIQVKARNYTPHACPRTERRH